MVAQLVEQDVPLYGQQWDFVYDEHRYVAFIGGRGSGKTYAGSWKAAHRAMAPGLGLIAAPDFPMLEFGAKRAFVERLEEMRIPFTLQQQKGLLTIPMTGAEVRFATLENESRVRGPNYSWAWPDEFEYISDAKVWRALKGSVRHGDNPQIFGTSTPKGRRIAYEDWVVNATDNHALYKASSYDNTFINAEAFVSGLGYTGAFFEQEINAEFVGFEGLVYSGFSRELNVKAVDCEGWGAILGVDAGVRNPSAIVTIRHVGDHRHQEREFYQRGLGSDALKAAVREEADRQGRALTSIEIDPSAAGLIVDLEAEGYPVNKANNNVTDGIRVVTTALSDGMTIDPSCVHTIDEYESYAYSDGAKREDDKPVKQNDHCMDGTRYALMGLAGPQPEYFIW